jgi:hypothetical protein
MKKINRVDYIPNYGAIITRKKQFIKHELITIWQKNSTKCPNSSASYGAETQKKTRLRLK